MKRTDRLQKRSVCIAVVLFPVILFFSFSAAFHHHEDGFSRDDCPLCIAVNLSYATFQHCSLDNVFLTAVDMDLAQKTLLLSSVYVTRIYPRAPPA